jgi:hypothetical protein
MSDVERDRGRWLEVAVIAGLAVVPVAGGPMSVVADELFERRRRRIARLGADVLADHDADEVLDRLRTDERFGEIFVRAAEATAVSAWEPKRRAMGLVVRAALDGDDAEVDDSELVLIALERLEAPHFAALQRLDQATAPLGEREAVAAGDIPGLTTPILAALISVGAAEQLSGWDSLVYKSSDFGRRLLALVTL